MLKKILLFLLLVAIPLPAAEVIVTPMKVKLGKIKWGTNKEFSIRVINNSGKPLHITRIVTYCGFLRVDRSVVGKPIPPGKEVVIKGDYRGKVIGYFGKVIEIYTDNPNFPKIEVEVTGRVYYPDQLPKLEIEPRKVKLGLLYPGESKQFKVKVYNKGNKVLKISYGGVNLPKGENTDSSVVIPPGKAVEIAFEFRGERRGDFKEVLWLTSNDPFNPRVPVVVEGKVIPYSEDMAEGASFKKLVPLFLFLSGFVVIVFAVIRYV